jgi:hypothetical protein
VGLERPHLAAGEAAREMCRQVVDRVAFGHC